MLDLHITRLRAKYAHVFNTEQAAKVVARAFGYENLDLSTYELSGKILGLQDVRPYEVMLKEDPQHQFMDFMRMSMNLALTFHDDVRRGVPEREIIAAMCGFTNYDALVAYARSDAVDPNTTDPAMLKKFANRYGYLAPIQFLLGRYHTSSTLVIQPDEEKAQRLIDQEIALNPLQGTKVAIVRDDPHGANWLRLMQPDISIVTGELNAEYPALAQAAMKNKNAHVAIVPAMEYRLDEVVEAHIDALVDESPSGRTLIVDVSRLNRDRKVLDAGYELANQKSIHLVVIVREPDAELWVRSNIRFLLGFDPNIQETYMDMDRHIGYAATYVGFRKGKMQYLYQSTESGARFGAMDLIPDDPKTKSLLDRMRESISGNKIS